MISEKLLIVNFGGPRSLDEVESFLISLLTDRDLISSKMPDFLHRWFFTYIAKKRARKVKHDYDLIGGGSPIFGDTEFIAESVSKEIGLPFLTFHRYLAATHTLFIKQMQEETSTRFTVFPLFPQFSYTTTGSIARWFTTHLSASIVQRLEWVSSYSDDSAYIEVMAKLIQEFLHSYKLNESETILLFSAHGLPKSYIDKGDGYENECKRSFEKIASYFPEALSQLSYQSKFGKEEWLRPYTDEFCKEILSPRRNDKQVVFIPLSFTSDHVETLYEIEYQYLPLVEKRGLKAYRAPALNRRSDWIRAIGQMIAKRPRVANQFLYK